MRIDDDAVVQPGPHGFDIPVFSTTSALRFYRLVEHTATVQDVRVAWLSGYAISCEVAQVLRGLSDVPTGYHVVTVCKRFVLTAVVATDNVDTDGRPEDRLLIVNVHQMTSVQRRTAAELVRAGTMGVPVVRVKYGDGEVQDVVSVVVGADGALEVTVADNYSEDEDDDAVIYGRSTAAAMRD